MQEASCNSYVCLWLWEISGWAVTLDGEGRSCLECQSLVFPGAVLKVFEFDGWRRGWGDVGTVNWAARILACWRYVLSTYGGYFLLLRPLCGRIHTTTKSRCVDRAKCVTVCPAAMLRNGRLMHAGCCWLLLLLARMVGGSYHIPQESITCNLPRGREGEELKAQTICRHRYREATYCTYPDGRHSAGLWVVAWGLGLEAGWCKGCWSESGGYI